MITDPYADLPTERQHRSSFITDKLLANRLTMIRGRRSTIQITINILLQKLFNELNTHGITEFDPVAYDSAINGCSIVLGGTKPVAQPPPPPETVNRNDGCGTPSVVQQSPGRRVKSPNPRRTSTRQRPIIVQDGEVQS